MQTHISLENQVTVVKLEVRAWLATSECVGVSNGQDEKRKNGLRLKILGPGITLPNMFFIGSLAYLSHARVFSSKNWYLHRRIFIMLLLDLKINQANSVEVLIR